ncbi:hypothetical protein [Ensifer sp. MJa1]|uniref:hypothetical protein n=1 Tax=Ensifer sp. MJa1 TaxID=2919888 RepID=UPI003008ACF6
MDKSISGGAYARAWGWRFALFVFVTLAFPFFVYALVQMTGAAKTDAAGAFAVVLGVYLKPIIYLTFVVSLARISIARGKAIGMPGKFGIYIVLLALADLPFALIFGTHWGVSFVYGLSGPQLPSSLLSALIALVTLSLATKPHDPLYEPYATAYRIWSALLHVLLAYGLLGLAIMMWPFFFGLGGMGLFSVLRRAKIYLGYFTFYPGLPLSLFLAASVYLVYASRKHTGGAADSAGADGGAGTSFGLRRD